MGNALLADAAASMDFKVELSLDWVGEEEPLGALESERNKFSFNTIQNIKVTFFFLLSVFSKKQVSSWCFGIPTIWNLICLFDLILYVPSTIFQL